MKEEEILFSGILQGPDGLSEPFFAILEVLPPLLRTCLHHLFQIA